MNSGIFLQRTLQPSLIQASPCGGSCLGFPTECDFLFICIPWFGYDYMALSRFSSTAGVDYTTSTIPVIWYSFFFWKCLLCWEKLVHPNFQFWLAKNIHGDCSQKTPLIKETSQIPSCVFQSKYANILWRWIPVSHVCMQSVTNHASFTLIPRPEYCAQSGSNSFYDA